MKKEKIKVLQIISTLSAGGIESFVSLLCKNLNKEDFQIDFAVFSKQNPIHEGELLETGCKIFYVGDAGRNNSVWLKVSYRIKSLINYYKLLKKYKYDVVHCHNFYNYGLYILLAKLCNVQTRIVHCHTAGSLRENWITKKIRRVKRFCFEFLITDKVACSNKSADWMYGETNNAIIIYNGIDVQKFNTHQYLGIKGILAEKYGVDLNKTNLVHVGRYSPPKNQVFLIQLFYEYLKKNSVAHLHIVGTGSMEKQIKDEVERLNLKENVTFYKYSISVPELLSLMDCFLLPSLWEGLPVTAIESQYMGLPTYISDNVTKEVDMGLCRYIPINLGPEIWADFLNENLKTDMKCMILNSKASKFDITFVTKQIVKLYRGRQR